jgi:phage baseplate assembly protein V
VSQSLYETIQHIVREELARLRVAELATVQDLHPHASGSDKDNYACTIKLRDSGIVLKQVPVATGRIGSVCIPAVGELVLVQFIGGDLNGAVITGRLYNDQDRPPVNQDGQHILHVPLGAGDDDAVHIELTSDKRQALVKLGKGLSLTAQDDDPVIKIEIDGGKAKIQVDRDGAVSLESQGDVKVKGNKLAVEAQGELNLKGSTVNIKGNTVNIN